MAYIDILICFEDGMLKIKEKLTFHHLQGDYLSNSMRKVVPLPISELFTYIFPL